MAPLYRDVLAVVCTSNRPLQMVPRCVCEKLACDGVSRLAHADTQHVTPAVSWLSSPPLGNRCHGLLQPGLFLLLDLACVVIVITKSGDEYCKVVHSVVRALVGALRVVRAKLEAVWHRERHTCRQRGSV